MSSASAPPATPPLRAAGPSKGPIAGRLAATKSAQAGTSRIRAAGRPSERPRGDRNGGKVVIDLTGEKRPRTGPGPSSVARATTSKPQARGTQPTIPRVIGPGAPINIVSDSDDHPEVILTGLRSYELAD